jgi:excisionase family DNA binding protein
MTDNLPKLLTEGEAAAYLGVNPRTLARLRLAGKIEYVRISERRYRYLESQLLTYLKIKNDLARARVCVVPALSVTPVQRRKNIPVVVAAPMFPKPRRRGSQR